MPLIFKIFLYKSKPKISARGTTFIYKMHSMNNDISFKFETQRLTLVFIRQLSLPMLLHYNIQIQRSQRILLRN